jgi:hypothetical protein
MLLPLPRDFHGPYLELRAFFLYNMEAPRKASGVCVVSGVSHEASR